MFDRYLVSPREAYAKYMLGHSLFVDVREKSETNEGSPAINNILNIPFSELEARSGELPTDRPVVFFSWVGSRSHIAARLFSKKGVKAKYMEGGVVAWKEEGLPLG